MDSCSPIATAALAPAPPGIMASSRFTDGPRTAASSSVNTYSSESRTSRLTAGSKLRETHQRYMTEAMTMILTRASSTSFGLGPRLPPAGAGAVVIETGLAAAPGPAAAEAPAAASLFARRVAHARFAASLAFGLLGVVLALGIRGYLDHRWFAGGSVGRRLV